MNKAKRSDLQKAVTLNFPGAQNIAVLRLDEICASYRVIFTLYGKKYTMMCGEGYPPMGSLKPIEQ